MTQRVAQSSTRKGITAYVAVLEAEHQLQRLPQHCWLDCPRIGAVCWSLGMLQRPAFHLQKRERMLEMSSTVEAHLQTRPHTPCSWQQSPPNAAKTVSVVAPPAQHQQKFLQCLREKSLLTPRESIQESTGIARVQQRTCRNQLCLQPALPTLNHRTICVSPRHDSDQ